ncbi:unnamed protein product [Blepharisma stoltei]|uniref:Aminopeptidase n=1 Tax=Blepharisma stoltei TaxID=1481888 RepID=A0AAU9K9H3_9CILI|nr:unnamed protein product [Blepharisma stoltei]
MLSRISASDWLNPSPNVKKALGLLLIGGVTAYAIYSYKNWRASSQKNEAIDCLTSSDAAIRSQNISNVEYYLKLNTQKGTSYWGCCTIIFKIINPQIPTFLDFEGDEILSILINGQECNACRTVGKIYLKNLQVGVNSVEIRYKNKYSKDGNGLHRYVDTIDGEEYLNTQFEPFYAHRMFPCFDQPDIKAILILSVKCPAYWKVISNEPIRKIENSPAVNDSIYLYGNDDCQLITFSSTDRISTYLYALCAGPFLEFRKDDNELNIPIGFYCKKSLENQFNVDVHLNWTIRSFKFYQEFFGILYPFKKYDQMFLSEMNYGAMENVGCVTYREHYLNLLSSIKKCKVGNVFLHEMAHMWFGNLVTMKWWDDLWLNESFATFMSHLNYSQSLNDEFSDVWLVFLRRKRSAYELDSISTSHSIWTPVENTLETTTNFDAISYNKGSSVLKQLHYVLGPEIFQKGVRAYLNSFKYQNAKFDDLINALNFEAKQNNLKIDLKEWAQRWVKTIGVNSLTPELEIEDGKIREFKVKQLGSTLYPTLRDHKILVELFDDNMESICKEEIFIEPHYNTFFGKMIGKAAPSCVVLNVEDYGYCKVRFDKISLENIKLKLDKIGNKMTRMLILSNLYEMVRDCLMPVNQFLEVCENQFVKEEVEIIESYILEIAHDAITNWVEKQSEKVKFYTFFFHEILKKLSEKPNLRELRYKLFRFIQKKDDIVLAVSWIKSSSDEPGLKLTIDESWAVLKAYSSILKGEKTLIEEFKENDKTSTGVLAYSYCLAAYPENKEATWNKILFEGPEMSAHHRRAIMTGFMIKYQKKILQFYTNRYFKTITSIIKTHDLQFVLDFCEHLFPSFEPEGFLISEIRKILKKIPQSFYPIIRFFNEKKNKLEISQRVKSFSRNS